MAEIVQAIATQQSLEDLHRARARALKRVVSFDLLAVIQADLDRRTVRPRLNEGQLPPGAVQPELPLDQVPEGELLRTRKALVIPDVNLETRWPVWVQVVKSAEVRSVLMLPLFSAQRYLGVLIASSREVGVYNGVDLGFLELVASIVASAVDNALNFEQLTLLKNRLPQEKINLEEEIRTQRSLRRNVGGS